MKLIKFIAHSQEVYDLEPSPKLSKTLLPEWFKNTPKWKSASGKDIRQIKNFIRHWSVSKGNDSIHATYKMCVPFLDTMTSGYTLTLPASIVVGVTVTDSQLEPVIQQSEGWTLCDQISSEAGINFPRPVGHYSILFRWLNNWKIQTPKGYSLLITHPQQRYDLPFTTLTGLIDTDNHLNPIVIPFVIREGFEGIIEAGTPIAQIFPIKRESWISRTLLNKREPSYGLKQIKRTFNQYYKNFIWVKKNYS